MAIFRTVRTSLKVYSMVFDEADNPSVEVVDLHPVVLEMRMKREDRDVTAFGQPDDD